MRIGKPEGISDVMWADFNRFCAQHHIVENRDIAWLAYYAGYDFRCAENQAAMA
jgi:hypothetical protein